MGTEISTLIGALVEGKKDDERDGFEDLSFIQLHYSVRGDTALVTCESKANLTGNHTDFQLNWMRQNETFNFSRRKISDNPRSNIFEEHNLQIEGVQLEDAGKYTCHLISPEFKIDEKIFYYLKVFDNVTNLIENFSNSSNNYTLVKAVVNDTMNLPCQVMYLEDGIILWEKSGNFLMQTKLGYSTTFPPRMQLLTGLTLEIQKLQPQDNATEFTCDVKTNSTSHKKGINFVFNETIGQINKCLPSPCGLNTECHIRKNIAECTCRKNFDGIAPFCSTEYCEDNKCEPSLVCLSEKCENLCKSSCGINAHCIIEKYKYVCNCLDGFNGNPYFMCNQTEEAENIFDTTTETNFSAKIEFVGEIPNHRTYRRSNFKQKSTTARKLEMTRPAVAFKEDIKKSLSKTVILRPLEHPRNSINTEKNNVITSTKASGSESLLLSIGGPILILFIVMGVIIMIAIRIRKRKNHRSAKWLADEDITTRRLRHYMVNHPEFYDEKWEFPRKRIIIKDVIGEGHFERVLKAQAKNSEGFKGSTTVAVKTIKGNATGSQLEDLISEYKILKILNHPNIIRFFGVCTQNGPFYIITEYAEHGCLRSFLRSIKNEKAPDQMGKIYTPVFNTFAPKVVLNFAWQIAKGMAYLADMKLVHKNLTAKNIHLTQDLTCKISGFGQPTDTYQEEKYQDINQSEEVIKWTAIETLSNQIYSTKSDVWSFGIVLWELITFGETPYPGLHGRDVYDYLKLGNRMGKPKGCSDEFYVLMLSCWKDNSVDRPQFQDLVYVFENMLNIGVDYLQYTEEDIVGAYLI